MSRTWCLFIFRNYDWVSVIWSVMLCLQWRCSCSQLFWQKFKSGSELHHSTRTTHFLTNSMKPCEFNSRDSWLKCYATYKKNFKQWILFCKIFCCCSTLIVVFDVTGKNCTMSCNISTTDTSITWTKDDSKIDSSAKQYVLVEKNLTVIGKNFDHQYSTRSVLYLLV